MPDAREILLTTDDTDNADFLNDKIRECAIGLNEGCFEVLVKVVSGYRD